MSAKNLNHQGSVFRFFYEESHAIALASGNVWISTLETCRKYEDPEQGDPEEAHEIYNSGLAYGGSDSAEFVEKARRSQIHIGPGCSKGTLINNKSIRTLSDAYVLCTTVEFSPEKLGKTFGHYCVEINDPIKFFKIVSTELEKHTRIREAAVGKIIYKDRNYKELEKPPGPIGFVKSPDKYSPQKEYRFLWLPKERIKIEPFLLCCPEVESLCQIIIE